MIDWAQLWTDFDVWFNKDRCKRCKTCGHLEFNEPDWGQQMRKIQRLVNKQLKEKTELESK